MVCFIHLFTKIHLKKKNKNCRLVSEFYRNVFRAKKYEGIFFREDVTVSKVINLRFIIYNNEKIFRFPIIITDLRQGQNLLYKLSSSAQFNPSPAGR